MPVDVRQQTLARKMAEFELTKCTMRADTNIRGADSELDFWLIIYSVPSTGKCY